MLPDLTLPLATLAIFYSSGFVLYRLFFHPLAHFPGPFLAKITYLYEWYYDLYLKGQYTFNLKALHERYGPVIRINPDEIHVYDPDYFEHIFNQRNGRANKPFKSAQAFGPYPATIGTQDHDLHRVRRSALNLYFSKKSVQDLIPAMQQVIEKLCDRLQQAADSGDVLNMKYFFNGATLDIITEYCFSRPAGNLSKPDFGRKSFDDVDSFVEVSLWNTHIPLVMRFIYHLPDRVNAALFPAMADILSFRMNLSHLVEAIRRSDNRAHENAGHRTVFHELLESKLPPEELERDRLRDEAFSLVTAGSGTSAQVLRGTAYHISANPRIQQRLHAELESATLSNASLPLSELEKLPYLTAVVNEGLRLCSPVTHRSRRQFPDKALDYHGQTIPAGTTVCVTGWLIHRNATIFPEAAVFEPERWLSPEGRAQERYLVPFNRGTRSCLGVNLAKAELYLILAAVYRRFDFDVSQIKKERDIDVKYDFILGAPAKDSPGILVRVKQVG